MQRVRSREGLKGRGAYIASMQGAGLEVLFCLASLMVQLEEMMKIR